MADIPSQLADALRDRYLLEHELGHGATATVYLARDLKHGRLVALKVLRPELATAVASERFLREIRIAAHLTHPHILPLLDSGEADGSLYFTMPFVEGETLRTKLVSDKQLRIEDALRITSEVADALTYAHAQGVVHRDIKPENILIQAGHAVVSDFGIARALTAAASDELTATGLAIGTPAYMSPEQATAAREVDGRSDLYSLACVLYEMLVGHPPFVGATVREVLARHSLDPVPPVGTVRSVPEPMERALLRALAKTPADRFPTAAAFVTALEGNLRSRLVHGQTSRRRALRAIMGATVLGLGAWLLLRTIRPPAISAPTHTRLTFSGQAHDPAISPDGRLFAYGSDSAVLVQDLAGGQPVIMHRARGIPLEWSPDGSELLFAIHNDSIKAIFLVSALGGVPRHIWHDSISDGLRPAASWSPDGSRIAIACRVTLCIIDKWTGESISIAQDTTHRVLDLGWSAENGLIAFVVSAHPAGAHSTIWTTAPDGTKRQKIVEDSTDLWSPRWSRDGNAIYYLRGAEDSREIWKISVSGRTGRVRGSPSAVASGLQPGERFTLSADGRRLLYARGARYANLWLATIRPRGGRWAVQGKQLTTGTLPKWGPNISPDGRRIAFTMGDGKKANVYTMGIEGDSLRQITFFNAFSSGPVWSPDGRKIAFGSTQAGEPDVWTVDASGGYLRRFAQTRLAHNFSGGGKYQLTWSDNSTIVYQHAFRARPRILDAVTGNERWLMQIDSIFGGMGSPRFSPTGRLLALRRFPPFRSLWLVFLPTGTATLLRENPQWFEPLGWSSDERWIYVFEHTPGKPRLTRVSAQWGKLEQITALPFLSEPGLWGSMSPDGNRFVFEGWHTQYDVWMAENLDH